MMYPDQVIVWWISSSYGFHDRKLKCCSNSNEDLLIRNEFAIRIEELREYNEILNAEFIVFVTENPGKLDRHVLCQFVSL